MGAGLPCLAAGLWLSHLFAKVSAVQYPPVGVINWPRSHELLGWSSASPIPGWPNVSLQAQRARQCRFPASISGRQVERRKWPSAWFGVRGAGVKKRKREGGGNGGEGKPVVSEGMFQTHGGLFILKAVKIHLEAGGQRNLQGGRGKKEIDAPTHTARVSCVMSEKRLGKVPVYLAGGSGAVSSHSDTTNKSRLTSGHQGLHLCCRFQKSEALLFKTHRQVEPIKKKGLVFSHQWDPCFILFH